jgi:hypothetical protein
VKAAGIGLAIVAYTLGSWGYLLVKGYNVTLREWVTPLHPFSGTLDSKGCVPPGFIFPTSSMPGVPCKATGGLGPKSGAAAQIGAGAQQAAGRLGL